MSLPAIRPVEAYPAMNAGQYVYCLRDPGGYVEEQVVLTPGAFFIASHLDGQNNAATIQAAFKEKFKGKTLSEADLNKVIDYLDKKGYLHTQTFEAIRKRIDQAFKKSPVRPAYLAKKSYTSDPKKLKAFLDKLFTHKEGPGEKPAEEPGSGLPLRLLVAPHIDFIRGGHAYAHAYLELYKAGKPKVVFIFGVAHDSPVHPFILTRKDFDTPLGKLETDKYIVDRLAESASWNVFTHEKLHRTEHSIEFQAVMLAYLYGSDVRIVPILCGSFDPSIGGVHPKDRKDISVFLETCREILKENDGDISVIAAADLAHVGQWFGDSFDVDEKIKKAVESRDREDLAHVQDLDPEKFYASVMKDQNERRVCGVNCIYSALQSVDGTTSTCDFLHYGQAPDPQGGMVSFASLSFK